MSYSGWDNWETWNLFMWLTNDADSERAARRMCTAAATVDGAAAEIEALISGANPLADGASWYHDVLRGAIGRVDWRALARALRE